MLIAALGSAAAVIPSFLRLQTSTQAVAIKPNGLLGDFPPIVFLMDATPQSLPDQRRDIGGDRRNRFGHRIDVAHGEIAVGGQIDLVVCRDIAGDDDTSGAEGFEQRD